MTEAPAKPPEALSHFPPGALPKNFPAGWNVDNNLWVLLAWVASLSPQVDPWELRLVYQEPDKSHLWLGLASGWRAMTDASVKSLILAGLPHGLNSIEPLIELPRPHGIRGLLRINSGGLRSFESHWP